MSRIVRAPYQPGDLADAARANTEFSAFSQPGAIDGNNLRDAAIDLPQLDTNVIILNVQSVEVGTGAAGWRHTAPRTILASALVPQVKYPLVDGAGNPTPLGPINWTINPGDVLRVYWDLSVRALYVGTPWVGNMGQFTITQIAGPNVTINDGAHCWLISLQWDVTDATLTNWTDVSGQTGYTSAVGNTVGGRLSDSPASVPVPAWKYTTDDLQEGSWRATSSEIDKPTGWTSASGAWYYTPNNPVTIYGLRLVIHGLYHPAQTVTDNYLVFDAGVAPGSALNYDGGTLTAIHQRTGA